MTLLVRDEQDILRANIEYHLAQGVDFFIVTDNRSVDATAEILKDYAARGLLRYIFEAGDDYRQSDWVTRMARLAYSGFGADWVINSDADEFWWPKRGTLRETLAAVPSNFNVVQAERHNFVAVQPGVGPFFSWMIYQERTSLNPLGLPLPPKVAHRGDASVIVEQGNHSVSGIDGLQIADGLIEILHYPIRNQRQLENKITKGGAAYKRNRDLPESVGITWKTLFNDLKRDGHLDRYFGSNYFDETRIAKSLAIGDIVVDKRLSDFFRSRKLCGQELD
jgi:glycosyl transferase family 2